MAEIERQVRPTYISKADTSAALSAAWARVCMKLGKGRFADLVGVDIKTISRALAGETLPELHAALSSLRAHPTALDEVAALFGVEIRPRRSQGDNDFAIIADLSHLVGEWVKVMADGRRDHHETLELADIIRPLLPSLNAIVAEADRIKGIGQ